MAKPTSSQPRKQRNWLRDAPLHTRRKMLASALDKELKAKYKRNSLPVRKGDTVKIMRGNMKGHSGQVMSVDTKNYKIFISGVIAKKADGKEVERPIHPSNVMITELNEEDKQRRQMLQRTSEAK
jgi:large subunit ribosomal protein L24